MTVIKIVLALLLVATMLFLMTSRDGSVEADQEDCDNNDLKDIRAELCGLEYDIYAQQNISDDINRELIK
jgi:hypothetical protein